MEPAPPLISEALPASVLDYAYIQMPPPKRRFAAPARRNPPQPSGAENVPFTSPALNVNASSARENNIPDLTADSVNPPSVAAGSVPPTLPPSVEEAYRKKCIELKRRMNEVEESNDAFRLRKVRLMRGIRKMRLERAFLLEILGKRMKKNGSATNGVHGVYDEDSEGSSEGPPTVCHQRPRSASLATRSAATKTSSAQPLEKPLRSKRSHRRPVPSPPASLVQHLGLANAPQPSHPTSSFPDFQSPPIPTTNGTSTLRLSHPNPMNFTAHTPNHHAAPSATNTHHNHLSPASHHTRLLPPPSPFDDFFETQYAQSQRYPEIHTDEQLAALARRAWEQMGDAEQEPWRALYEQRYQAYAEALNEGRGRGRERERRRERDGEREKDRDGEGRGGLGSGGGFTAVNG